MLLSDYKVGSYNLVTHRNASRCLQMGSAFTRMGGLGRTRNQFMQRETWCRPRPSLAAGRWRAEMASANLQVSRGPAAMASKQGAEGGDLVGPVAAQQVTKKNSILSMHFWASKGSQTNMNMLLFRTINRRLGLPNHNADVLADAFRDELMPVRSFFIKRSKGYAQFLKVVVQHPRLGVPGLINFVDARTRWLDQEVAGAIAAGVKQVVVVAAGFDSRAYRFAQEGLHCFEVDLPAASGKKQAMVNKLLTPEQRANTTWVAADLSSTSLQDALASTPFSHHQPAMFIVEGLIYYLPASAVSSLFGSISRLATVGSCVCFDFLHADALLGSKPYIGYQRCAQHVANKGEPWLSGFHPSEQALAAFLEQQGFALGAMMGCQQLCEKMLPHLTWSDATPEIAPFWSFVRAEKAVSEKNDVEY